VTGAPASESAPAEPRPPGDGNSGSN
jgi:hypothetical protein